MQVVCCSLLCCAINCYCFTVPIWTKNSVAFIVSCGPLPSSLPPPSCMQQGLLMRSVEQCINTEPRWRCMFVMGHSDTTLRPELMTTTASNLGHSRRTIIHCLPHEKCGMEQLLPNGSGSYRTSTLCIMEK